jgi:hypothetical protein
VSGGVIPAALACDEDHDRGEDEQQADRQGRSRGVERRLPGEEVDDGEHGLECDQRQQERPVPPPRDRPGAGGHDYRERVQRVPRPVPADHDEIGQHGEQPPRQPPEPVDAEAGDSQRPPDAERHRERATEEEPTIPIHAPVERVGEAHRLRQRGRRQDLWHDREGREHEQRGHEQPGHQRRSTPVEATPAEPEIRRQSEPDELLAGRRQKQQQWGDQPGPSIPHQHQKRCGEQ